MSDHSRSMEVPLGKLLGKTALGEESPREKWTRRFYIALCCLFCGTGLWIAGCMVRVVIARDWFSPREKQIELLAQWTGSYRTKGVSKPRAYALFRFSEGDGEKPHCVIADYEDEQPNWLLANGSFSSEETHFESLKQYVPCRFHPGFSIGIALLFPLALMAAMTAMVIHFCRLKLQ